MTMDRWCWWPVGDLQGVEGAIACGRFAPHCRLHPDDGAEVWMCDEHTEEFHRLSALAGT